MDVVAIFAILLPIKIVVRNLSKFSVISSTSSALSLSSLAKFFILILLTEVNAVSVAEKMPDNMSKSTMLIMYGVIWLNAPSYIFVYPINYTT